jgi:hypothetical protein
MPWAVVVAASRIQDLQGIIIFSSDLLVAQWKLLDARERGMERQQQEEAITRATIRRAMKEGEIH